MISIKTHKNSAEYYNLHNKIKLNMEIEDGNLFAHREKQRAFAGREQWAVILMGIILFIALLVSILTVVVVTNHNLSVAWVLKHLMRRVNDIIDLLSGNRLESGIHFFMCQFSAPVLAGAALAAAGACYQGVFRNPMASPTLLGVQSGGVLGAAVYVLFFPALYTLPDSSSGYRTYGDYVAAYYSQSILQHNIEQFFVLAGCLLVVAVVVGIARVSNHGKLNTVSLMLGGTVFTSMITTVLGMVQYYLTMTGGAEETVDQIRSITTGRFTTVTIPEVLLCMAVPIVISLVLMIMMSDKLNVIVFGEEEAKTMGINVERYSLVLIGLSTVMTAAVVAFCGQISFIGLIIPQFARFIVGPNFKYLIPASVFLGGLFMLLAFDLIYMIDFAVNIGTVVNAVGGVLFLISMIIYRRKGNADWT